MHLSNYLFFTTTCEQALDFYTTCGLGKMTEVLRYGIDGMPLPNEAMHGRIMHAKFEVRVFCSLRQITMTPSQCAVPRTFCK
jgi:uncharacterized glyoxalase superfamily protein PhnB